jgi:hypothetical protein
MMRVRLETREGELVTMGRVPPFNIAPEVLIWGVRVFRWHERAKDQTEVYREAFATYLIEADA